jgi:Na+/melibiose symporter-like transporter
VSADAVLSLAIMSGPVMFLLFAATVIVSSCYPLTVARHAQIMQTIAARKPDAQ